jgi:hypothetical protein
MIDPEFVNGFEHMAKQARKGKVIAVAMSFLTITTCRATFRNDAGAADELLLALSS